MVDIKLVSHKVKGKKKAVRLTMTGRLTIEHAREVRKALEKALQRALELELELENIEDIDLSCIQLFCSTFRTAGAAKKKISFSGKAPKCFRETALEAGFYRPEGISRGNDEDCLWLADWNQ